MRPRVPVHRMRRVDYGHSLGARLAISAETSETPNDYEIYTINVDGTELDRVTQDWRWDIDPAWSR